MSNAEGGYACDGISAEKLMSSDFGNRDSDIRIKETKPEKNLPPLEWLEETVESKLKTEPIEISESTNSTSSSASLPELQPNPAHFNKSMPDNCPLQREPLDVKPTPENQPKNDEYASEGKPKSKRIVIKVGSVKCSVCGKLFKSFLQFKQHKNECNSLHSRPGFSDGIAPHITIRPRSSVSSEGARRTQIIDTGLMDQGHLETSHNGIQRVLEPAPIPTPNLPAFNNSSNFASRASSRKQKLENPPTADDDDDDDLDDIAAIFRPKEGHLPCDLCGIVFEFKCRLIKHRRLAHPKAHASSRPKPSKRQIPGNFPCEHCGEVFGFKSHLSKHRSHAHPKPSAPTRPKPLKHRIPGHHPCKQCGTVFAFKSQLKKHKHSTHPAVRQLEYPCELCDKVFKYRIQLDKHIGTHSIRAKVCPCNVCSKSFASPHELKDHMRRHTGEKPFACGVCGFKTAWRTSLKVHKRSHQRKRPLYKLNPKFKYVCDDCGMRCKTPSKMGIHCRKHTGAQPFGCSICHKRFSHVSNWLVHERRHTDDRPFICDGCGRGFYCSNNLRRHRRTHLGKGETESRSPSPYVSDASMD